jgi:hypothetical protein
MRSIVASLVLVLAARDGPTGPQGLVGGVITSFVLELLLYFR